MERRVESPGKGFHARQHAPEVTTGKADVYIETREMKRQAMKRTRGRKFRT